MILPSFHEIHSSRSEGRPVQHARSASPATSGIAGALRSGAALVVALACVPGCAHSYGLSGVGATSFSGRTTGLAGLSVRSDLRLPRRYFTYLGTEATIASQFATTATPASDAAGNGQPAEHAALAYGWLRLPDGTEHWGGRFGLTGGGWHGALGDGQSRWALDAGLEGAAFLRIGRALPPWQADETISVLVPVLIPSVSATPMLRLGQVEDSRWAIAYAMTLSVGLVLSPTVVP